MSYLVIGGEPTATSRKAKLASKDVNRHYGSAWYYFDDLEQANRFADDLLRRHPKWQVAVCDPSESMGKHP